MTLLQCSDFYETKYINTVYCVVVTSQNCDAIKGRCRYKVIQEITAQQKDISMQFNIYMRGYAVKIYKTALS